MNVFRYFFRFFIYSNLFIACCAILMLAQTCSLILHTPASFTLLAFVFCATMSSYSFHWYLTPSADDYTSDRISWLRRHKQIHLWFFILGTAGALFYGIELSAHWRWLIFAAGITFLYSAPKVPHPWFRFLRRIAVGKTIFLAGVWAFVTSILPLGISGAPWRTGFTLFCISRFFLIYAICILFDYRDREYDISIGIRSLVTKMTEVSIDRLFSLSLLIFFAASIGLFYYDCPVSGVISLIIPGGITALLYNYSKKRTADMLYYFILDGLMALSAVLYYGMLLLQ